jgi:hypothetical protein
MFDCKRCEQMKDEIKFLREQNQKLTDHALVAKNGHAFASLKPANPQDYYGSSQDDEYVAYDEFGQKVLMKKDIEL